MADTSINGFERSALKLREISLALSVMPKEGPYTRVPTRFISTLSEIIETVAQMHDELAMHLETELIEALASPPSERRG